MLTWYTPDLLIQSLAADQYHIIMSCSDAVAEHDLSKASNSNSSLRLWHSDSYEQGTWLKACLEHFLPFTACLFII